MYEGDILREKFIEELLKEVLGPRQGCKEIMDENPAVEYLTGVLIPKPELSEINENSSLENEWIKDDEIPDEEEDNLSENFGEIFPSELDPKLRARSFGISFVLESLTPKLDVCISWARYISNGDEENEKWERHPFYKILNFDVDFDEKQEIIGDDFDDDSVKIIVKTKKVENEGLNILISFVNNLTQSENYLDVDNMIFQPSIRINSDSDFSNTISKDVFDNKLSFVYKDNHIRARGHMCSALWDNVDYINKFDLDDIWPDGSFFIAENNELKRFIEPQLRTEFVPLAPMGLPSFDIFDGKQKELNLLNAEVLSEIWSEEEIDEQLSVIVNKYSEWIETQKEKIEEEYMDISLKIIDDQIKARDRIQEGIDRLKKDEMARLAFCFANKAILTQYEWKNSQKEKIINSNDDEVIVNEPFNWRGFQLAFFLMNIESIVNPDSEYRDYLDLLWITTGGGKTEAYLAIMAFTIAYRRLTNENYGGTSIISRYTLRLLTIQQFERTLLLVTAAEYLRVFDTDGNVGWRPKNCTIKDDWIYGSLRFSIGMWVGSAVTPNNLLIDNSIQDKYSALAILKRLTPRELKFKSNPVQVIRCPVCGNLLSIPEGGIPTDEVFHVVVKLNEGNIEEIHDKLMNKNYIKEIEVSDINHKEGHITLGFRFKEIINQEKLDDLFGDFRRYFTVSSLSIYHPGYFGVNKSEDGDNFSDFEIFCTNPSCSLNSDVSWKEGSPFEENEKLDIYYEKIIDTPFSNSSRIPIPAYVIDEQIYSRCPTIIIGTVDKIARLPYNGRIANIFGNVSLYNKYYGFLKNINMFPRNISERNKEKNVSVDNFLPPDLIIQDELHLIDGPLGSLFGIYELILESIIKQNGINPKYIASSATIKNATNQSRLLFAKELFQFPPHGLKVENNFFVREPNDPWDENNPGRIYMGVYAPGRGPMTPLVRLWSNMLCTSSRFVKGEDKLFYSTIVEYFNAMRELGGGISLYKEDINERVSRSCNISLDPETDSLELSSRLSSSEIPLELNKIQNDGIKDNMPHFKAIFTTSMFGTGVDISHLSLMILNGQPKTTGSYIQASGRIGRKHGGLVVTFLKSGRPRDLNHYEMFPAYHYKIQTDVEPISVSPFSLGSLEKTVGPAIVSFFRNAIGMDFDWDSEPVKLNEISVQDYKKLKNHIIDRLNFIMDNEDELNKIKKSFDSAFWEWKTKTNEVGFDYTDTRNKRANVVLGDYYHEYDDEVESIFEKAPNSLREVEESTMFWV